MFAALQIIMSGVEEVAKDIPPDEENNDVSEVKKDEVEESSVKTSSDSESGSLTGSWTLVEKEDEESGKKLETDAENGGSSIEVLDKKNEEEKQEGKMPNKLLKCPILTPCQQSNPIQPNFRD